METLPRVPNMTRRRGQWDMKEGMQKAKEHAEHENPRQERHDWDGCGDSKDATTEAPRQTDMSRKDRERGEQKKEQQALET